MKTKLFTLTLGRYRFEPILLPTMIVLILFALLLKLGFWQQRRAEQKQTLMAEYEHRLQAPPLSLSQLNPPYKDYRFYSLKLKGKFDNKHTLLLDNQIKNQQVGYEMFTPFFPMNSTQAILIDRGWIAMGPTREDLPMIHFTTGVIALEGMINFPTKNIVLSQTTEKAPSWPLRVQRVDIQELSKLVDYSLYPFIMQLDSAKREWRPTRTTPAKHRAYAFQWFALAATLLLMYFLSSTKKDNDDDRKS